METVYVEPEAELTHQVIGAAIEVHRLCGPGLLEIAYEACLCHEFSQLQVPFERQLAVPLDYKGIRLDCGFRVDLLVDKRVIVELKAVDKVTAVHEAQLLTYLKLARVRVGLIINFNVKKLTDGLTRRIM